MLGWVVRQFPLILAIMILMSSCNFMLSGVEHEKCFITLGSGSICYDSCNVHGRSLHSLSSLFNSENNTLDCENNIPSR